METLKVYERVSQHFSQDEKRARKAIQKLEFIVRNIPSTRLESRIIAESQYLHCF